MSLSPRMRKGNLEKLVVFLSLLFPLQIQFPTSFLLFTERMNKFRGRESNNDLLGVLMFRGLNGGWFHLFANKWHYK